MDNIEKEIEAMADQMEKSVQDTAFTKEMLHATVIRLGAEGLRKAIPRLSDAQKTMLNEVLEDMKKSHRALIARDKAATTEPQSNSTPAGDYLHNEDVKPAYTEHDETLNEEARKRGQMVHRNQGGNNAPEGWEGQVIKSDKVEAPAEKNEQKKKEEKAELDSHKEKSPAEKKFEGELTKAGEGTRGGKVIGHTKSGKAIYDTANHAAHSGFTHEDHKDAHGAHEMAARQVVSEGTKVSGSSNWFNIPAEHQEQAKHHFAQQREHKRNFQKSENLQLVKAGEEAFGGDYGVDGDRIMKKQGVPKGVNPQKHEDCVKDVKKEGHDKSSAFAICNASMKKAEGEMNLEEKKEAAGSNLKATMKRMQERKMEKSACVSKLAKALEVGEEKIGQIWDLLAKGASEHQGPKVDGFKYDDGKTGTAPAEAAEQSRVPAQMKKGEDAGVKDSDTPDTPAYKDKAAKKVGGDKKPESGRATETADETISKVPDTMGHKGDMKKSDYWHEEESVYLAKSQNPFAHRTTGQNVAYKVDEFVEAEHNAHKDRLSKSTFDYLTSEQEDVLRKGGAGSGRHKEKISTGPLDYKNRDKKVGNLFGKDIEKADPEAEAAEQAKEVNRQAADAAKEEKENQRQAQVDEKLTRIEERSGPKIAPQLRKDWDGANAAEGMMKVKKSFINDLLEKGLDLGDDQAIIAQANRTAAASGAFLVKSFADDEMDALFKSADMWKSEEKEDEKKKDKKKEDLKKDDANIASQGTTNTNSAAAGTIANFFRTR